MNDNDTLADDLRKDSLALVKLLADEKHKSEALAADVADVAKINVALMKRNREIEADLARCRAANVYDAEAHRKASVLDVAGERIRSLTASLWQLIDCLGRYPQEGEPAVLTNARELAMATALETFVEPKRTEPCDHTSGPPGRATSAINPESGKCELCGNQAAFVIHSDLCPVRRPDFVPIEGVTQCNCDFGKRLAAAMGVPITANRGVAK